MLCPVFENGMQGKSSLSNIRSPLYSVLVLEFKKKKTRSPSIIPAFENTNVVLGMICNRGIAANDVPCGKFHESLLMAGEKRQISRGFRIGLVKQEREIHRIASFSGLIRPCIYVGRIVMR